MIKNKLFSLLLLLAFLVPAKPAHADGGAEIVLATVQISNEQHAALIDFLNTTPPVAAHQYALTYASTQGTLTYISLVALSDNVLAEDWSLEDAENTLWMGTVTIEAPYNTVQYLNVPELPKTARPSTLGEGGGPDIAFPWEAGKSVLFGPRGVHGDGDYGTVGMYAIDAVVNANFGTNIAEAVIYASYDGTIDYVCADDTSTAIRTDDGEGNVFVYAHIVNNETLDYGTSYTRGEPIGGMVFGTFGDVCGWGNQQDTSAHVHWMFNPLNGYYQAEDCVINVGTDSVTCGSSEIQAGGFIQGGGGSGGYIYIEQDDGEGGTETVIVYDTDDLPASTEKDIITRAESGDMTFFDYILVGTFSILNNTVLAIFPVHEEPLEYIAVIKTSAIVIFRIAYVLLVSNINVGLFMGVMTFLILFWIIKSTIDGVLAVVKIVKLFL